MKDNLLLDKKSYCRSSVFCFDVSDRGHRLNYLRFFARRMSGRYNIGGIRDNIYYLMNSRKVIFPTFESAPLIFTIIAAARSILWRRTALLILRPIISSDNWRSAPKRFAHWFLANLPFARVLVVTPLNSDSPLVGKSTFLFDPEFWDIDDVAAARCQTPLSDEVVAHCRGRTAIICAGMFYGDKGMAQLLAMMRHPDWPADQVAVAITGQFAHHMHPIRDQLIDAGAFVEDRFLSDEELFSVYTIGDSVWACYAPSRDMSSGLVGRAVQFGLLPIVRDGSVLTQILGDPSTHLSIAWDDPQSGCRAIQNLPNRVLDFDSSLTINKSEQQRKLSKLFIGAISIYASIRLHIYFYIYDNSIIL